MGLCTVVIFLVIWSNPSKASPIEWEWEDGLGNHGRMDNIDERGPHFEGDMVLDQMEKSGLKDPSRRWPENTVVYSIDSGFSASERSTIMDAMAEISSKTCIQFRERSDEDEDYVDVTNARSGCASQVGRVGGAQVANLGPGCVRKGTVMHELLHSIGFLHEQNRPDRDDYVTINWDNVPRGRENPNFMKSSASKVDPFGVSYDYGSIMHYSAYAFAKNRRRKTIVTKQRGVKIGQRQALSEKDVQKVNNMYNCNN